MSSGLVSQRTRMTSSPSRPRASAVSASKTTLPDAAPGRGREAASRPPRSVALGSIIGCRRWSICAGSIRAIASLAVEQPLLDHRDRGSHRGGGGALRGSGLEEVQPPLLDRELDVLHVAVVALESLDGLLELGECGREEVAHLVERSGMPDARDDVLPLSVDEELAADAALAGRGVAAEADARRAVVALVPEHHLHHVDGGAEVVRDLVGLPVHARTRRVPGVEDRAHRAQQLLVRVERERPCPPRPRRSAGSARSAPAGRSRPARRRRGSRTRPSALSSACSKRCESMPSTTSPYIWISRRYES